MVSRWLHDAVNNVLISGLNGELITNIHVVLVGLPNAYSQYVTTFKAYQVQRAKIRGMGALLQYTPLNFFLKEGVLSASAPSECP